MKVKKLENKKNFYRSASFFLYVGVGVVAFAILAYAAIALYLEVQRGTRESCISSIETEISWVLRNDGGLIRRINPTREWKALEQYEKQILIDLLKDSQRLDCPYLRSPVQRERYLNDMAVFVREGDKHVEIQIKSVTN